VRCAIGAQAVAMAMAGDGVADAPGGAVVVAGVELNRRRALREGLVLDVIDDAVELGRRNDLADGVADQVAELDRLLAARAGRRAEPAGGQR